MAGIVNFLSNVFQAPAGVNSTSPVVRQSSETNPYSNNPFVSYNGNSFSSRFYLEFPRIGTKKNARRNSRWKFGKYSDEDDECDIDRGTVGATWKRCATVKLRDRAQIHH